MLSNFKGLASLGGESIDNVVNEYEKVLEKPKNWGRYKVLGAAFGYSFFIRFMYMALVFLVAGSVGANQMDAIASVLVVYVTGLATIQAAQNIPDRGKGKKSKENVFRIVDQPSLIDVRDRKPLTQIYGQVEFSQIYFMYPNQNSYLLK